jgi:SP family sugar:H+ symporter-like MFS transporter
MATLLPPYSTMNGPKNDPPRMHKPMMTLIRYGSTALGMDETAEIVTVVLLCLWAFVFGGTIAASANPHKHRRTTVTISAVSSIPRAVHTDERVSIQTAMTANLSSVEMHSVSLRTFGQANTTVFYGIFAFGATLCNPSCFWYEQESQNPNDRGDPSIEISHIGTHVPWKTSLPKNKAIASQKRNMAGGNVGA